MRNIPSILIVLSVTVFLVCTILNDMYPHHHYGIIGFFSSIFFGVVALAIMSTDRNKNE